MSTEHANTKQRRQSQMENIIDFKAAADRPTTEPNIPKHNRELQFFSEEYDEEHAKAFRDLEDDILACMGMADVAVTLIEHFGERVDERLSFAVFHLNTMLLRLTKKYKAGLLSE
jgi:hypothetical protein